MLLPDILACLSCTQDIGGNVRSSMTLFKNPISDIYFRGSYALTLTSVCTQSSLFISSAHNDSHADWLLQETPPLVSYDELITSHWLIWYARNYVYPFSNHYYYY